MREKNLPKFLSNDLSEHIIVEHNKTGVEKIL
jgi:hypothetical protein